jgi:hypothetical protein
MEQRPNELRDGVAVNPAMPTAHSAGVIRSGKGFSSLVGYLLFPGAAAGVLLAFAVRLLDGSIGLSQLLVAVGEEIRSLVACRSCAAEVGPQPDLGPLLWGALSAFWLGFWVSEVLGEGLGALGQRLRQRWLTRVSFIAGTFSAFTVPCLAVLYYLLAPHGEVAIGRTLLVVGILTGLLFGSAGVWLVADRLRSRSG